MRWRKRGALFFSCGFQFRLILFLLLLWVLVDKDEAIRRVKKQKGEMKRRRIGKGKERSLMKLMMVVVLILQLHSIWYQLLFELFVPQFLSQNRKKCCDFSWRYTRLQRSPQDVLDTKLYLYNEWQQISKKYLRYG